MLSGTFAVVSLMVGTVVDNSDCGSSSITNDDNVTTISPDTEAEGFTEVELCKNKSGRRRDSNGGDFSGNYMSKKITLINYRLGPVNSNTVNSKLHLIQTFFKISATFLSFQC